MVMDCKSRAEPGLLHSTGIARPIFVIPAGNLKNRRFVDCEIPCGNDKVAETRAINVRTQQPCLEKFRYLTGRSLSTFNRDFRKTFNSTPQKWLTRKRLEQAHYRIAEHAQKPVDVYLEVGFENLSHFSFAFKKAFWIYTDCACEIASDVAWHCQALIWLKLESVETLD